MNLSSSANPISSLLTPSLWKQLTVILPAAGGDIPIASILASEIPYRAIVIENKPYGAAIKTGIRLAKTEWVAMMDGDGQHALSSLFQLTYFGMFQQFPAMVIGLRSHWQGRLPSILLNLVASLFANQWVPDLGSGLRVIHRPTVLPYLDILPDDFSFNSALTMAFLADELPTTWAAVDVGSRYTGSSHVRLSDGFKALWQIIRIGGALRTREVRKWLRVRLTRSS